MIIDTPVAAPPGAPINRPPATDRLGGGSTAAPTESPRPLNDPEEGNASRRNEERANAENRPGRNDAELAARARVDAVRGRSADDDRAQTAPSRDAEAAGEPDEASLSRQEIQRLRDRLEARLAGQTPVNATLRSIDETI
jgi:hypothetical protein